MASPCIRINKNLTVCTDAMFSAHSSKLCEQILLIWRLAQRIEPSQVCGKSRLAGCNLLTCDSTKYPNGIFK